MSRRHRQLIETYFSFDPRSLGLFRILFGLVLLADLGRRYLGVNFWYTDEGIVSGTLLRQADLTHFFSLFLHARTHTQAVWGMALCAVIYGLFTVGFKTRLFHLLSLICAVSLNNRIFALENGGQFVLNLLGAWSFFLPLGRRFSLDALLLSLKSRRESSPVALEDRAAMSAGDRPVVSLAVLALLLQFAIIYLFNLLHKTGAGWRDGSAVHYALYQERLVTVFGVWLREHAPYALLQALSWSTLALEGAAVVLILGPVGVRPLRRAAILLLPALHIGFTLCLHLGIFSYAMACFFALLLSRKEWEWWEKRRRRRTRAKVAFFDADCGLCFQFCRIFARLDPGERVRFVSNREGPLPPGTTRQLAERAIIVQDTRSGAVTVGVAALAALVSELPCGSLFAFPLRLPGVAWVADRLYDVSARNRTSVSRFFGLAACGMAAQPAASSRPWAPRGTPARGRRGITALREASVLVLMAASAGDLARSPAWPQRLRYSQPELLGAIIAYPRLFQYWQMFSPDVSRVEQTLAVRAETVDGRVVDPYNEVASRSATILLRDAAGPGRPGIPTRLGQSQFFAAYSERLPQESWSWYYQDFRNWILRYHERTGDPRDRIVRFRVESVVAGSPAPGQTTKGRQSRRVLFELR